LARPCSGKTSTEKLIYPIFIKDKYYPQQ